MVIGITGTIGSGKSTLTGYFEEWGAVVIRADAIGWMILMKPEIRDALTNTFGEEILGADGEIDRRLLGEKAFEGASEIAELNRIVHPALLRELRSEIEKQRERSDVVFVDAALIAEWSIEDWFDKVIVVTCPTELKLKRLRDSGVSEADARRRLACQLDDKERVKHADLIVDNSGTLQELRERAKDLFVAVAPRD